MKKTTELIVGIISLVLIAAMALGVFSVLKSIDVPEEDKKSTEETAKDTVKDTSSDSGGDDSTDETQAATVPPTGGTTSGVFIHPDYDLGYITQGNITIFFAVASAPQDMNVNEPGGCYDVWSFTTPSTAVFEHVSTDLPRKYSTDGGLTWLDMYYSEGVCYLHNPDVTTNFVYLSNGQEVFIAYSIQENVENPRSLLETDIENMASSFRQEECVGCEGTYTTCFWNAYHKRIPVGDNPPGVLG